MASRTDTLLHIGHGPAPPALEKQLKVVGSQLKVELFEEALIRTPI
jgi:hypothetical protein